MLYAINIASAGSKFRIQLRQAAVIVSGGVALFAAINLYRGNEKFYEEIAMPLFRHLPPEIAQKVLVTLARYKIVPKAHTKDIASLKTVVWGKSFSNPIGLAAGLDRNAEAVDGFLKIGFGFVEVGSVTPKPQSGNPQPRVFQLEEDEAFINRMGLSSDGHEAVYHRLRKRFMNVDFSSNTYVHTYLGEERNMLNIDFWTETETDHSQSKDWASIHVLNSRKHFKKNDKGVVGVNLDRDRISPNPVDDYVKGVRRFGRVVDYLVVNISNFYASELSDMRKLQELTFLLNKVIDERDNLMVNPKPALLIKISLDLTQEERKAIAAVITKPQCRVDGLIVSNSSVARPGSLRSLHRQEQGGLSGQPLKEKSVQAIRDMYIFTQGQIPIIGVGGVSCGQDAYDKVKAGASLIQIYTALMFHGPPVVDKIKKEIGDLLKHDGYSNILEAVGADVKQVNKVITGHT